METCVFCRIGDGAEPASVVYADGSTLAFMDIAPIVPGHLLVMPRRHGEMMADMSAEEALQTFSVARVMAAALRRSDLRCEGVNLLVMDGEAAFQDVPHFHIHVVPRFPGDGFSFRFPTGYGGPVPRQTLDDHARRIREAI